MAEFLLQFNSPVIYLFLLALLIAAGVGNPIPEDAALITGGYLVYAGVLKLYPTLFIAYIGVLAGDLLLYSLGFKYGQKIVSHKYLVKLIPPHRIERIRKSFQRRGCFTILFARFLVGFRSPTFLLSGVMHLPFRKFILLDGLGALLSVPLFVGLGFLFGSSIDSLRDELGQIQYWGVAIIIVAVTLFITWYWKKMKREEKIEEEQLGAYDSSIEPEDIV